MATESFIQDTSSSVKQDFKIIGEDCNDLVKLLNFSLVCSNCGMQPSAMSLSSDQSLAKVPHLGNLNEWEVSNVLLYDDSMIIVV